MCTTPLALGAVSGALLDMNETSIFHDHPAESLRFILNAHADGRRAAVVIVVDVTGGTVRTPGAAMAVDETGGTTGYVSNGCLDQDVAAQALMALKDGRARRVRYGEGSPFMDIQLPCGGSIDLLIIPDPDIALARKALETLEARAPFGIAFEESGRQHQVSPPPAASALSGQTFIAKWTPRLRVRIAGRGVEVAALTRVAIAAGFEVMVQSPDAACAQQASALGALQTQLLTVPNAAPRARDDPFTAFVLLFHDHEWELDLLRAALQGEAFYIGALGSRRTHALRREVLRDAGVSEDQIDRVRGPIGLVPSMRDSGMLAISTLAELISVFQERHRNGDLDATGADQSTA